MKNLIFALLFSSCFFIHSQTPTKSPEELYESSLMYYERQPEFARAQARKILEHPRATPELQAEAYLLIGKTYFEELRFKRAIDYLSKVQTPKESLRKETGLLLYEIGLHLFHEKPESKKRKLETENIEDRYILAVKALKNSLEFLTNQPQEESARLMLGTIYAFGGHGIVPNARIVIKYVQPVYDKPSNLTNQNEAGYLLGSAYFYLGAENKDKVIELLTPVTQENSPYKFIANQLLAYTYFNAKDWNNAIIFINHTLQSPLMTSPSKDRSELEIMLGKAYYQSGQYEEAKEILKKQLTDPTLIQRTKKEIGHLIDKIQTIKESSQKGDEQVAETLLSLSEKRG